MKIAVVTDSTSDLPSDLAEAHHIEVVPNLLMIENQTFLDGKGLSREEYYQRLPSYTTPPSTAAPSIGVYQKVYERILKAGYTHILSLHPAGKLSALYSVASVAAQSFADSVHVFDSNSISLGLGFQAIRAVEAAARGAGMEDILHMLEGLRNRVRVYALLDTLQYVQRSGRAHWVTSSLTRMLGLKALIEVRDGVIHRIGLTRSRRQAVEQLIRHIAALGPLERFAILHTTIPDPAEIELLLKSAVQVACDPFVTPVTTIVGTHIGPKGLGIVALTE